MKVGILADDHKISKFKELLDAESIEYTTGVGLPNTRTTTIFVEIESKDIVKVETIRKICSRVELHFKQGN